MTKPGRGSLWGCSVRIAGRRLYYIRVYMIIYGSIRMRFHGLPEALLASPGRFAVLKALMRQPRKAWTGSELARAAGVTPRWAIETLRLLEAEGVVRPESIPP